VRILLALLLILGISAAPAAARKAPTVPAGWLGVMADGPLTADGGSLPGEWRRMSRAGAESVRIAFFWRDLEPEQGRFDFASSDRAVARATKRRLRILPTILRTPGWARDGDFHAPPRDPELFAGVMDALVARYGPQGSFWAEHPELPRRPLRAWQIWNEPSLPFYWGTQPFAESYVALLRVAARTIRAADPGARVVLAGLTNESWKDLRSIYEAGGRGHFDVVALHPYTKHPDNVLRIIRYGRRVMEEFGDGALPVWATEIGWAAIDPKRVDAHPTWKTSPEGQADLLRYVILELARARKRLKLERVMWYTWLSRYTRDEWTDYTGLRKLRGERPRNTPAAAAFRRVALELNRRRR
jgi:hypothetical protein